MTEDAVNGSDEGSIYRRMLLRTSLYGLAAVVGALASALIATHWLDLLSAWSASLIAGAFGGLGAALRENIGDALMMVVVSTALLAVFIFLTPVWPSLKGAVLSIAVGFCTGKLLGGIWKEVWNT
jgi:hypothetical protein